MLVWMSITASWECSQVCKLRFFFWDGDANTTPRPAQKSTTKLAMFSPTGYTTNGGSKSTRNTIEQRSERHDFALAVVHAAVAEITTLYCRDWTLMTRLNAETG